MEGRIAAKLEPDTPATFGDSAGVALKDDKEQGEAPWKSTLPAMGQQHIVDEIMSDATDELSPREDTLQEPQVSLTAQQWPASQEHWMLMCCNTTSPFGRDDGNIICDASPKKYPLQELEVMLSTQK